MGLRLGPIIVSTLAILLLSHCTKEPESCEFHRPPKAAPPSDPIAYGHQVFETHGCTMCHGADGKSGIRNPNAKTDEQIPPVIYVAVGYTPTELKQFVLRGQPNINKMQLDGPTPPFRMPRFAGALSEGELDALQKYLFSLKPAETEEGF